ncbi:MAG: dTDP-4-dehydrorhamnose 3,5-epimerase [Marinilabiliaceae bacterium]|nr:dTDP-4-dehydrorhamnose 3,5-epimerase [Marinilabiliaceae bacterium]
MKIETVNIPDLYIIKPTVYEDSRGFFYELYNQKRFSNENFENIFVQDNISLSQKGTIRGLHYQLNPFSQAKLVTVIKGKVLDVVVDLRKKSPTFGKWFSVELSEQNRWQLLIPKGFAHGFSVLSKEALFLYKCDNEYNKECERGINIFDTYLNIDWKISKNEAVVSEKDFALPLFSEAEFNF